MGNDRVILLDTCALLWLAQGSTRISAETLAAVDSEPIVSVSAVSAFEICLKQQAGKLSLPLPAEEWWGRAIAHHRLEVIDLDSQLLMRSTRLPPIHRDLADRFIIATALDRRAPIVTADKRFVAYGVRVLL
ncbi:MAG: type II toxin-antitoxin system VapC family toxin [Spirochaetales bacterium]|nr:type II toxin-antitoxin system VapC family toxin [Spirochaetales bacterium]